MASQRDVGFGKPFSQRPRRVSEHRHDVRRDRDVVRRLRAVDRDRHLERMRAVKARVLARRRQVEDREARVGRRRRCVRDRRIVVVIVVVAARVRGVRRRGARSGGGGGEGEHESDKNAGTHCLDFGATCVPRKMVEISRETAPIGAASYPRLVRFLTSDRWGNEGSGGMSYMPRSRRSRGTFHDAEDRDRRHGLRSCCNP